MYHQKSKKVPEKASTFALLTMPRPLTVWIATDCGKFLEMGIPGCLNCFLRNLCAGQETIGRTGHVTTDWFLIGKGYVKAVYVTLLI